MLENYLSTMELPIKAADGNHLACIGAPENVDAILKKLYNSPSAKKIKEGKDLMAKYVIADDGKEKRKFFAKNSQEGPLREALGLELNNLLTGRIVPYALCGGKIIVTDEVTGKKFIPDIDYNFTNNIYPADYAFQYGVLQELSKPMGLSDRSAVNIVQKPDNELWSIDFGCSFMHDSSKGFEQLKCSMPVPEKKNRKFVEEGALKARAIIMENLGRNMGKVRAIMHSMDEDALGRIDPYYKAHSSLHNPKDILLNYIRSNDWKELERRLE